MQKINKKTLFKAVLRESYNIFSKAVTIVTVLGQNEKNNLKNIGSWIGQLTLGRNKPIVMKYLNIKNLLADSYPSRLHIVLPPVCKILE
jgi:CCR4-NOT transcription complex subunit 1